MTHIARRYFELCEPRVVVFIVFTGTKTVAIHLK